MELDENTKDREILQQEIKTALEINIENAKQFEKQLEGIRQEQARRAPPQNIRVPVNQTENRGLIASFFGIKQVSHSFIHSHLTFSSTNHDNY